MRHSYKLAAALALTAAVAVPAAPAAQAATATSSCRVEFYDLDAIEVAESDGKDEIRVRLLPYLYPAGWVNMRAGDDADPADFNIPDITISGNTIKSYSLREVTPPLVGAGVELGAIEVYGGTCGTLDPGEVYTYTKNIVGTYEESFWYVMKVRMIGQ